MLDLSAQFERLLLLIPMLDSYVPMLDSYTGFSFWSFLLAGRLFQLAVSVVPYPALYTVSYTVTRHMTRQLPTATFRLYKRWTIFLSNSVGSGFFHQSLGILRNRPLPHSNAGSIELKLFLQSGRRTETQLFTVFSHY